MKTKILDNTSIDVAVADLLNNKVIAFPTETVYGLGVRYDSSKAFKALIKAKNRPENKPFTLMCANTDIIDQVAYTNEKTRKIINKYMPGPLTILLKKKDNLPEYVTMGLPTVGIRIPDHPVAIEILNKVGCPLLVPSANKSGLPPCKSKEELLDQFDGVIPSIVIGEISKDNLPSTIIDCSTDDIKLIRQGPIPFEDILSI